MRRFALLLLTLPVFAAYSAEPVRVYTNADLSQFGPPTPAPAQPLIVSVQDWTDLERFLDREYARLDADRLHELDRRESDRRDRVVDLVPREDYWLPNTGYWPFWGQGVGFGWGGASDRVHHRDGHNSHGMPDRPKRWNDLAGGKPAGGGGKAHARTGGRRASGR